MRWLVLSLLVGVGACSVFGSDPSSPTPPPSDGGSDAGLDASATLPGFQGPVADLATGQQTPADIVLDPSNLYWVNQASGGNLGTVMKLAKSGGATLVLTDQVPAPYALTADATRLYFTANNDGPQYSFLLLFRQDMTGGPSDQRQVTANGAIFGCALQGGVLFFVFQPLGGDYAIGSVATSDPSWSTPVVSVTPKIDPSTVLAADGARIYAGSAGKILAIAKADGQTTTFATTTGIVKAIVYDPASDAVFWTDESSVRSLATSAAGGAPTDLATGQPGPTALAVDAVNVYWTNVGTTARDGSIRAAPKTGGITQTISTGEVEPLGIAVDDSGLYWTNHGDGRVRVLRR